MEKIFLSVMFSRDVMLLISRTDFHDCLYAAL